MWKDEGDTNPNSEEPPADHWIHDIWAIWDQIEGEPDDGVIMIKAAIYNFGGSEAENVDVVVNVDSEQIDDTLTIQQLTGAKPGLVSSSTLPNAS